MNAGMMSPAMAGAGGGDTNYYNTFEVPLEILRDEPNLQENGETLAEAFMRKQRGAGR